MMFSGGGFDPAVASPVDKQASSVEQQLLDAVEGTEATVKNKAGKPAPEAPKANPEAKPSEPSKEDAAKVEKPSAVKSTDP